MKFERQAGFYSYLNLSNFYNNTYSEYCPLSFRILNVTNNNLII